MKKKTRHAKKGHGRASGEESSFKARLAGETGYTAKPHGDRLKVALVYPNSYQIGMSNLGFAKVYHMLNAHEQVVCERAFMPDHEELERMRQGKQKLCAMESGLPLSAFDVIAFSITFELDYANALSMLGLGGVGPARAPGRPLLMAGGIAVTMNPEVMAGRLDLVLLGEAEGILGPLVERMLAQGTADPERFAGLPGVYVTQGYQPRYTLDGSIAGIEPRSGFPQRVSRVWDKGSMDDPNITRIHTQDTVFGGMALVETGKGCGRHCRFCAAGYSYRPTRFTGEIALTKAVDTALEKHGRVGLVGSAVADHPGLEAVMERAVAMGGQLSLSSMRLDMLTERFLDLCWRAGIKTITVAPEAASPRLRRIINKELSDEKIIMAAGLIGRVARFNLKLYFLVGLPWELEQDVEAIAELTKKMRDAMVDASKERGTAGSINVSVNGFVPKPWTPFQWAPFAGVKAISDKFRIIRQGLKGQPNITLSTGSPNLDLVQAVLSVGDRRMGELAQAAAERDGDWISALRWLRSEEGGNFPAEAVALGAKTPGGPLPWDIVDYGLKEDYLEKEYKKAQLETITANCPPPGEKCLRCGVFTGVCADGKQEGL
ncbi:MAG: B12-binding domain-containing radical SAM protein [Nitrospinota bacterium]|nr:B12-binding domain-containing radical SAM protein [Nitrospinota bacterium]